MTEPNGPDSTAAGQAMAADAPVRPSYARDGPSLFWLALRSAVLTILTLGIYRFWMTAALRRHYWSAIRLMGDPFEYTGTGLEKLLGFLVAVIVLAVYLSMVNLTFVFVGLYSTDDLVGLQIAINLSVVASLPLIYYASYRARRYIMARTRWRSIRFGMELAAWGYTGRAMALVLVSIVTLGLLYPLQHFRLAKFMTDRTWFGDLRFGQDGRWQALFGYWVWVHAAILITAGAFAAVFIDPENPVLAAIGGIVGSVSYLAIFIASLRYRVMAFRYLWSNRTLGGARFRNDVDLGEVIGITIAGSMGVGMVAFFAAMVVIVLTGGVWLAIAGLDTLREIGAAAEDNRPPGAEAWPVLAVIVLGYLSAIAAATAFSQIFLIRPILRRQAEGMMILNGEALAAARQRGHDDAIEAGGFADALGVDVGSGF